MKLYFPYLIFSILIISNKLFLFNEEFLILICFIAFSFFLYLKLNSLVNSRFSNKIMLSENLILDSLNKIEDNLIQQSDLNKKIKKFKSLFSILKNYYLNLVNKFVFNFTIYTDNLKKSNFVTKLYVFKLIELEYSKLIFILINKKLISLSKLIFFANNTLVIKRFKIINKINKLILLKKI
uniref:ATP synthase F0 subunit b n=1 Tax=Osmundea sinicola TaxID=290685 RepID=A0A7L4WP58_9FLOR|nr:ATP synthase F0 subunit b [Osmundea sinicola]QFR99776.1 ATP synthase F0 subunit b [Osmundea sinicola]